MHFNVNIGHISSFLIFSYHCLDLCFVFVCLIDHSIVVVCSLRDLLGGVLKRVSCRLPMACGKLHKFWTKQPKQKLSLAGIQCVWKPLLN